MGKKWTKAKKQNEWKRKYWGFSDEKYLQSKSQKKTAMEHENDTRAHREIWVKDFFKKQYIHFLKKVLFGF